MFNRLEKDEHGAYLRVPVVSTISTGNVQNTYGQVLGKPPKPIPQPVVKFKCDWCHGYTPDDDRGMCVACGGPREYSARDKMFDDIESISSWRIGEDDPLEKRIISKEYVREKFLGIEQSDEITREIWNEQNE